MKTRPVYIVAGMRTPFVKSMTHYMDISTQELMTTTLQALVTKLNLSGQIIGDVGLGAVMNSSSNWNLSRECVLGTTLSPYTPGYTLQRACGTSLETTSQLALKIANYQIDNAIAAGVDTNSDSPIMVNKKLQRKLVHLHSTKSFLARLKIMAQFSLSDLKPEFPAVVEPRTHLSMGQHCEKMVQEWQITREAQDAFSLKSHQNGAKAYQEGFFDDMIFEYKGLKRDTILRADTTLEKLSRLKPAFDFTGNGSLTAGNSSPLTDGAAAVFLACEDYVKNYSHPPLARFVDAQASAVDFVHGDGLLMAPTIAVTELLKRNNLSLQDFDFYEIHEAFAGQVLCTLKAWETDDYCKRVLKLEKALGPIDPAKINIKGSSIALGHPFAATGARIVTTLAKLLHQHGKGRGLISICTAGGMGVAAIIEAI
ncbi:MAG: acetyl-CoA acetyltransferase [Gammaproteobacteria bacterium 39-13]|nr:acetyl-CoA C-acetyltransferase [Gammaproteobacteria bacterium]OJV87789.1 MAG: acetyl-CoA acetyltransferase [Gammaproteobacteria bacterium 39-13]